MKNLNLNHLLQNQQDQGPCVSLYISPEAPSTSQDALRLKFKELIRQSRDLLEKDSPREEVNALLAPAEQLLLDHNWLPTQGSTAVFCSKNLSGYFKLPVTTEPLSVVARSFHLKPILRWRTLSQSFHLIRLMKTKAVLYRGSLLGLERITTLAPRQRDLKLGKRFENRGGSRGGAADDTQRKRRTHMAEFVKQVDRELMNLFQGETLPLLVAGNGELVRQFNDVNHYPYTVAKPLKGTAREFHERALEVVHKLKEDEHTEALGQYHALAAKGLSRSGLSGVAQAAVQGRVAKLFIAEDTRVWGYFDNKTGKIRLSEKRDAWDDDVLDDLAEVVMESSGRVLVAPQARMPTEEPVAAILRW